MKQDNSYILTINGGSFSIKFAFYQAGEPLKRKLYGNIDRIGLKGRTNEEVMIARSVLRSCPAITAGKRKLN